MADQYIQPGLAHQTRFFDIESISQGKKAQFLSNLKGFYFHSIPHAGVFQFLAKASIDQTDGGEIHDRGETQMLQMSQVRPHFPGGVGPAYACYHGGFLDHRKDPMGQVNNNLVGIPVGHQTGQGAFAIHTEQTGIVNPDQINSALLGEFPGNAGAGAGDDDRPTCISNRF